MNDRRNTNDSVQYEFVMPKHAQPYPALVLYVDFLIIDFNADKQIHSVWLLIFKYLCARVENAIDLIPARYCNALAYFASPPFTRSFDKSEQ